VSDGVSDLITYNFEYDWRVRAAFIGCGGHAWRNVLPALQYAPVDLVAVADPVEERAASYARQFGARRHYTGHKDLLLGEELDAVFVVTNHDETGRPRYPGIAIDAMQAGVDVWIEKPPAATADEIHAMLDAERDTRRFVQVGFKKMFFPAIAKAKEIASRSNQFGEISQIYVRYPEALPPLEARSDTSKMLAFLDHFFHPASIVHLIAGPPTTMSYVREPANGGTITTLTFANRAIGIVHMPAGQSWRGLLERLEVVGSGANVIVDNGVDLTYYRRGGFPTYGRAPSWIGPDDEAPLRWERESSLGQLYNTSLFAQGYAPQVISFCECARDRRRPAYANLDDALAMMRWYEAYRRPEGETVSLAP
jgi:predicted dehydrogenase